ncbi:internal virion protein D [Aeromonas phage Atoyac15]|uniref:Internal virion protein D n=1 Tax=Aeromonas phage Atoyac15 TaxID=2767551 RepID=A0A866D2U9_9CAUD|nr:internal virion protein D [Aeromonas phage Atoyac15]
MSFQVDLKKKTQYDPALAEAEQANGLPEGLLKLVMMIENRNDPKNRVSPKGASGVMQVMPSNFESLGITDPDDPIQNINGAGRLMAQLSKQYKGDVGAMLAHYNGGNKAAAQYLAGEELNPETTDYLRYAEPYFSQEKPSTHGRQMMASAQVALEGMVPSDLGVKTETAEDQLYTGLEGTMDKELQESAKYEDFNAWDAMKYGFNDTLTEAIGHVMTREQDENFALGEEHLQQIQQQFPQGLNKAQTDRLYNSRSQSDWDYNWQKTTDEQDILRRVSEQDTLGKAGATAAIIGGGLFDPAALPLSAAGAVGKVVKGVNLGSKVVRGAADGAIVTGALSPILQMADKGSWSGEEVAMHIGTGAVFGAGISGLMAAGKHGKAFADETIAAGERRVQGAPEYQPKMNEDSIGTPVNFAEASQVSKGAADEIIGIGATELHRAAKSWDESVSPSMQKVQHRRDKWYSNPLREKLFGWSDSEGVKLARSQSKSARFVQAMWSGNAAGLGKQEARNASVLKEQMVESMQWDFIPEMKSLFAESLEPKQVLDYMAGGAKDAQAAFSRTVQLERYKHRMYRAEKGSSDGYVSDAPENIQKAAAKLDELYGRTKELHMNNKTEHSEKLKDEDSVGYIEQRPDFQKLVASSPEHKKAWLDMVKDDYKVEAAAKVNKFREGKAEWIEAAYKRAEADIDKPWVEKFLKDPEAYFDRQASELSKKIAKEMERRASHWWENALRDPETRYQNSEASLLTLAKEMSGEWFSGRTVDAEMVKSFQEALTKKWADTGRRELNMLNKRNVNGEEVYLLDMFNHDVFGATTRTINDTAGQVAMAKMGWRKEQDIADTLDALRHDGATPDEVAAAKHISDLILNRAGGLDNSPLVQSVSNMVYANMMGKLPASLLADMPTIIGNLGFSGMTDALGKMAKHAVDGSLFVKNGRPTPMGNDLGAALRGLTGHDHLLWIPQQVNADGLAMEAGASLLRRTAAAARFTSTVSGTNAVSRTIGTAVTRTTVERLHKALRTGKGISANRLEDVGLNPETIGRIKQQFDLHSTKDEFGLDKWSPREREEFISAAHKFTNQNRIDRSYAGEVPQWSRDNILGYIYSKFRVIGIRAQEKVLTRNLSMMDSNTVAMMTSGLAFATFLSYARIHLDAATNKDGAKVLEERLTPWGVAEQTMRMSSVLGLTSELGSLATMMTGGGISGGTSAPLMGPIDNIQKAVQATGSAAFGDGSAGSAGDAWFKTLPGSNSYLLMGIKEAIRD